MTDVTIRLDDPIRLVSAVLAATNYPEKIQATQPHGSHAHARATTRYLQDHRDHAAVKGAQALLDNGAPLEALYSLVVHLPWPNLEISTLPKWVPPGWNKHLADFYDTTKLAVWWENERTHWDDALEQSNRVFQDAQFKPFMEQFIGEVTDTLVFLPNVSYPSTREIAIRHSRGELIALCPPRLAWGDSPPWPFDEDKTYIHRVTLAQYLKLILIPYLRQHAETAAEAARTELPVGDRFKAQYPTWGEQFINIFSMAVTALYLETLDERESRAYIQHQFKQEHVKILPGAVSVLRRYLKERENGKFNELADFLPVFPKQLKVAKKIMSI